MKKRNGLIIILDGLGDRPIPDLDGATPLEAAHTPNMDQLVTRGRCGLVDPLYPGVPVSTHTGAGVLFGINTRDAFLLPRGPVEAAGTGLPIMPGDIALRCNFATLRADTAGLELTATMTKIGNQRFIHTSRLSSVILQRCARIVTGRAAV